MGNLESAAAGGGCVIPGSAFLIFAVLFVLKATGVTDMSWWWITCPLWIIPAVIAAIIIMLFIIGALAALLD